MEMRRFDLLDDIGKFEKTPEGFLRFFDVKLTRSGIFDYRKADGSISKELRCDTEVFAQKSLASLHNGLPITNKHPDSNEPFVKPENFKNEVVGYSFGEVRQDGDFLRGNLTISDKEAIGAVLDNKRRQISLGYTVELEHKPGIFNGERYDCQQKNIRYNHIALVERGRAGPECSLRLDANDAIQILNRSVSVSEKQIIDIDGEALELSEEAVRSFFAKKKEKIQMLEGRVDGLKEALAKEKEGRADAEDSNKIEALVQERIKLLDSCRSLLGSDARLDGKNEREIKEEAIKRHYTGIKLDNKDLAYIDGVFDSICLSQNNESLAQVNVAAHSAKTDSVEDAREKWLRESAELSEKPLRRVA